MLRGNLSTRPFYNDRAVTLMIAGVAIVATLLTVYNSARLIELTRRRSAIHQRIATSEAQTTQLESETLALQQNIDRPSLTLLSTSAHEANRLIDDRTFSWSALFALLEQAMPMDVRLIAVSPRMERGQRIVAPRDQRRRRRAADPLHGGEHFDDGFLALGDRVPYHDDLVGELGELRFRLGQFCFARLNPLACLDQLAVELCPRFRQGRDVLLKSLLERAARLQLLRGLVEFLLRLLAGEIVLRRDR